MGETGARLRDSVRAQLWPLPSIAVVVAVISGELLPHLDSRVDPSLPGWLSNLIFGGDPDAARSVLGAVGSSLITVTSLTFSLTVVTLQLASSQFSPRLLRTFTRDLFVQATLAIFLATFAYALTVLRVVRSDANGQPLFVPRLSVTVAYLLAVASVLFLVFFLAHLTRQIRVETMLRNVHREATATVRSSLSERKRSEAHAGVPSTPPSAILLLAPKSGFLISVEKGVLLRAAMQAGAVVRLDASIGSSLIRGTPCGQAWALTGGALVEGARELLDRELAAALHTGPERTGAYDVGFGLRQLTDVVNKALSPGINDPTTAVHALGHISALLADLADRDLSPVLLDDDPKDCTAPQVRVVLNRPGLAEFLDIAITQPRRYGAADPQVMTRLFALLTELAWRMGPGRSSIIVDQLERLVATCEHQDFDATERRGLSAAEQAVRAAVTALERS